MGFMAFILAIISFIEVVRGEVPAVPAAIFEWSMPAMSPAAAVVSAVAEVISVAVVSVFLSALQLPSSRVPEQRAARKNADFFMWFGLGLAVKKTRY